MKLAAEPAAFKPSEGEIGAAMRTIPVHEAEAAGLIAEQNEVLAEKAHGFERPGTLQLIGQGRRLPVMAHELSGRVARAGPRDQVVLFLAYHGRALLKIVRETRIRAQFPYGQAGSDQQAGKRPPTPAPMVRLMPEANTPEHATEHLSSLEAKSPLR
jgi:hypothetical protein